VGEAASLRPQKPSEDRRAAVTRAVPRPTRPSAEGAQVDGRRSTSKGMHPKDLAAKYEVKVFDAPAAAEAAGFQLGQRMSPRNVWNRDSAASAILFDLLRKKKSGEVSDIALVLEIDSVTGAFK